MVPFLVAGAAVVVGAIGIGSHCNARNTNDEACRISQNAQNLYDSTKRILTEAQDRTEQSLLRLGYEKEHVLDTSMKQFLNVYDKIKHVQLKESVGLNEITKFSLKPQEVIEVREMTNIYSSSIKSGATGAAAGAVVALAASGSLPIVTGGLTTAGTALMAGEVGAAAGIAGSALSFGASMTPLAAIAAPVVLFTGISASVKADENLEKANAMYAEAEEMSEKMKISITLCDAITNRSDMFDDLLVNLNGMFAESSEILERVIQKKERKVFKKRLTSKDFSEDDLKLIAVTRSLAGAIKAVIDTPILSNDGNVSCKSEEIYRETIEKLPDFNQAINEVKLDYKKMLPRKKSIEKLNSPRIASSTSKINIVRRVFAIIIGLTIPSLFANNIAQWISTESSQFVFVRSYIVNTGAIWLVMCSLIIMLLGNFMHTRMEKLCGYGVSIGNSILFVQYCRSIEGLEHYIRISLVFLILVITVLKILGEIVEEWKCGIFMFRVVFCLIAWPINFCAYLFFSNLIGWPSSTFWLVTATILVLLISMVIMVGLASIDSSEK